MVLRIEHIPQRTLDGSGADSFTTGKIHGKILSIKFKLSNAADFIFHAGNAPFDEYIFGASGAAVTVSASGASYPRAVGNLSTTNAALGGSNLTNAYVERVVDSAIVIAVTNGTATTGTWAAQIFYED